MDSFLLSKIVALIIVLLGGSANGQLVYGFGECPIVPGQDTFDPAQCVGTWYEYQRFPAPYQSGVDCSTAIYTLDGDTINVVNTGTIKNPANDVVINVRAECFAVVPDPAKPADFVVSFTSGDIPTDVVPNDTPNYIIQETDYTSYSVVYACEQLGDTNIQTAWILTREPGVAPPNLAELESNLEAAGLDIGNFFVFGQTDCPDR
ncbi:apolipoprotein d-like [Plakobranchus ocellatus]|uniref:Apolipoprotein d-like n=1 Tax=Plakobranchus ocellatus TaxID=259542 RepID=A0AAV4C102_9GAST|nr:apolipoprotein d-like [Plakobranchus ocellatus]